jgi:hypothetical protein
MTRPIPKPFTPATSLALADEILSRPPEWPWVVRVDGRGELLYRFALPLRLLETQNRTRHAPVWLGPAKRRECYRAIVVQLRTLRFHKPLPGRPMVRAIRFSCSPTDAYSDWCKLAIDRLCLPRGRGLKDRLGLLVDDSPKHIDLHQWGERGPRGEGFGVVEIWSGESA